MWTRRGGSSACFNPRPRTEGNLRGAGQHHLGAVSIHALARRATGRGDAVPGEVIVSIHALARRATQAGVVVIGSGEVSIHALARRATSFIWAKPSGESFQSTPSHGGQHASSPASTKLRLFQSTPSHGGQRQALLQAAYWRRFQSTPSHGGQPPMRHLLLRDQPVSIHALARRATPW